MLAGPLHVALLVAAAVLQRQKEEMILRKKASICDARSSPLYISVTIYTFLIFMAPVSSILNCMAHKGRESHPSIPSESGDFLPDIYGLCLTACW